LKRVFLYIDILGFENLVREKSNKVEYIFQTFNGLKVFRNHDLRTVVFSDTILVFNKEENKPLNFYYEYLVEYAQELFYRLAIVNVYYRGIITYGEFDFTQLANIQSYYGLALIESYKAEKNKKLKGFGLYIDKQISNNIITFSKIDISDNFDYIILCQSITNLYSFTQGKLPVDIRMLIDIDDFSRIDEELRFFREIDYLRKNHPESRVRAKYQKVYSIYKSILPLFFKKFAKDGFLPEIFNAAYIPGSNPYEILAEEELKKYHNYQSV
jgi:hypothetical protein